MSIVYRIYREIYPRFSLLRCMLGICAITTMSFILLLVLLLSLPVMVVVEDLYLYYDAIKAASVCACAGQSCKRIFIIIGLLVARWPALYYLISRAHTHTPHPPTYFYRLPIRSYRIIYSYIIPISNSIRPSVHISTPHTMPASTVDCSFTSLSVPVFI